MSHGIEAQNGNIHNLNNKIHVEIKNCQVKQDICDKNLRHCRKLPV